MAGSCKRGLFTREERKTMMTLWCMFRSPLMIGAELTKMDDFTLSLLTNKELLVLLSEDFRGEQLRRYFFELFMKVGAAGKSSFFCNNIHSPVGSFKKLLCLINAHGCNVSTKSLVKFLMKYIRQIIRTHMQIFCNRRTVQIRTG